MKTLGISMESVSPGKVELKLPYNKDLTQQHGFIHAGIIATVLDSACGYAAFSLIPKDAAVLTVEFKINLLSPAKGEHFTAVGKVKKSGKNITVAEAEMLTFSEGKQKSVATMVGTIMAVYGHDGIKN